MGLETFIGQEEVKQRVKLHIYHSVLNNEALPHILCTGAPGLGKTTLARNIAKEMCVPFNELPAGTLTSKRIVEMMGDIFPRSIFFIDEIHGLNVRAGEIMYSIMQDFKIGNKTIPALTVIGGTTHEGILEKPLRDRFTVRLKFKHYSPNEIQQMLMLKGIDPNPALAMAKRAQGIPRIAVNTIYTEVIAVATNNAHISPTIGDVNIACEMIGIDKNGYSNDDLRILKYLADKKRSCSLKTIARALDIESITLEYVHERWLIKNDMIIITSKGREITEKGLVYIGG